MKNKSIVLFLLLLLFIPTFVFAENKEEESEDIATLDIEEQKEIYEINVDKKYKVEDRDNGKLYSYKDKKEVTSILIYTKENKYKLNISKYEKEDIQKQEKIFKDEMVEKYKNQKVDATINSLKSSTKTINGYDSIIFDIETKFVFDKKESIIYQKQYMFSSKNYVYYIIISSTKEEVLNNEEMTNMVDSFKINDKMLEQQKGIVEQVKNMIKTNKVLFTAFFSLVIFTIVFSIGTKKKRKTV